MAQIAPQSGMSSNDLLRPQLGDLRVLQVQQFLQHLDRVLAADRRRQTVIDRGVGELDRAANEIDCAIGG